MQRFYKGILITVLVLAVFILGAPYFFGFAAQQYTTRFVSRANETVGHTLGVHVLVQDYQRGWFHSTATLLVQSVNDPVATLQKIPVVISHGPFVKSEHQFTVGLAAVNSQSAVFDPKDPYQLGVHDVISFNGVEHGILFAINTNDEQTDFLPGIRFHSLTVGVNADIHAENLLFQVALKKLHAKTPDGHLEINADQLNATLAANFVKTQHWQLALGFQADQLQAGLSGDGQSQPGSAVTVDKLAVSELRIDTENMKQLLVRLIEFNVKNDVARKSLVGDWLQWLQQVASEVISSDTTIEVNGLSVHTPMGLIQGNYTAGFPLLPKTHDYFDVATHDVGRMEIKIPNFHVMDDNQNTQIALTNLVLQSDNNTFFSRRSKLSLDLLQMGAMQPEDAKSLFYLQGLLYHGQLSGDLDQLSQTFQWQLDKLCWHTDCFNTLNTQLQFLNLDARAVRELAAVFAQMLDRAQQGELSQQERMTMQWADMANAYLKMIRPNTKFLLDSDVMSPKGKITVHADVSWPDFPKDKTMTSLFAEATYQVHLLFPAAYVSDYLNMVKQLQKDDQAEQKSGATPMFATWLHYFISKGYLKSVQDTYLLDIKGKGHELTINGEAWVMPSPEALGLEKLEKTEPQTQ